MRPNRKQEIENHVADCLEIADQTVRVFMAEGYSAEDCTRFAVAAITAMGSLDAADLVVDGLLRLERELEQAPRR
jgi:hypothetical protein